jgi:hypothetical protein
MATKQTKQTSKKPATKQADKVAPKQAEKVAAPAEQPKKSAPQIRVTLGEKRPGTRAGHNLDSWNEIVRKLEKAPNATLPLQELVSPNTDSARLRYFNRCGWLAVVK